MLPMTMRSTNKHGKVNGQKSLKAQSAKFGTVLGMAPGGVPVYSCDYSSVTELEPPNRDAYRSFVDNIFMGFKWQCVELARRWLYLSKGYIFADVPMAYDIFNLRSVTVIKDGSSLPLNALQKFDQ